MHCLHSGALFVTLVIIVHQVQQELYAIQDIIVTQMVVQNVRQGTIVRAENLILLIYTAIALLVIIVPVAVAVSVMMGLYVPVARLMKWYAPTAYINMMTDVA